LAIATAWSVIDITFVGIYADSMVRRRRNKINPATSGRLDDLFTRQCGTRVSDTRCDSRIGWIWQLSCEEVQDSDLKEAFEISEFSGFGPEFRGIPSGILGSGFGANIIVNN
jgi:hypothetical protein